MECNFTFLPTPFLGTSFRQNHQIRALKSNSYPFLPTHRSLLPSLAHDAPSTALLTSRAGGGGSGFARTNLNSHRRKHLRRCFDLFHLSLQRGEWRMAGRMLRVVLGAHEWTWEEGWRVALEVLSHQERVDGQGQEEEEDEEAGRRRRISYLQQLDLESSGPFKATHTTSSLIAEYIASNRLSDAIELLEQRVTIHPYKSRPELHTLLGTLYVYVGITTLLTAHEAEALDENGVELRRLDRTTRNKARQCFETALQASASWVRGEKARRQRIWGMRAKDVEEDGKRVRGKRGVVWGRDLMGEEERWPKEEHADLKRVRRQLEGGGVEPNTEGSAGSGDEESDVSGSLYSPRSNRDDSTDPEDESRGRSRTISSRHDDPQLDPFDGVEQQLDAAEASAQGKAHQAWMQAWPQVAAFYTPEPPLACQIADQFLLLLGGPASSQQLRGGSQAAAVNRAGDTARRPRETRSAIAGRGMGEREAEAEDDTQSEASTGLMGGIQLTRDEAELRLRRILFEDAEPPPQRRPETETRTDRSLGGRIKIEKKTQRITPGGDAARERSDKRKQRQDDNAGESGAGKRRRRDEPHF